MCFISAERRDVQSEVSFALTREAGTSGNLEVHWRVHPEGGAPAVHDLHPTNGTVKFWAGQTAAFIRITIKMDTVSVKGFILLI